MSSCDQSKWIGTYASSSATSVVTENVDLTSLSSSNLTSDYLTFNGTSLTSSLAYLDNATQNQTSSLNTTSFTGSIVPEHVTSSSEIECNVYNSVSITSPTSTLTCNGSLSTPSSVMSGTMTVSNSSSVTLPIPLFSSYSLSSTNANVRWNIGRAASYNSCIQVLFNTKSLGSSTNYLKIGPNSTNGLVVEPSRIFVESTVVQENGIPMQPKIRVLLSNTTSLSFIPTQQVYDFSLSNYPNVKRMIIQIVNGVRQSGSPPYIRLGRKSPDTFPTTYSYVGCSTGNNGAATFDWSGYINLWNVSTSIGAGTYNHCIELIKNTGSADVYDTWMVNGYSTKQDSGYYVLLNGSVTQTGDSSVGQFNAIRVTCNYLEGYISCFVF